MPRCVAVLPMVSHSTDLVKVPVTAREIAGREKEVGTRLAGLECDD